MKEIGAQIDQDNRIAVQHETWGHLFPAPTTKGFDGTITVAYSIYGDIVVIDEAIDIDGSPWWFASANDFADKMVGEHMKQGEVYLFNVHVDIVKTIAPEIVENIIGYEMTEAETRREIEERSHEELVITETSNKCLVRVK